MNTGNEGRIGAMGRSTTRILGSRGGVTVTSYRVIRSGANGVDIALNVNARRWRKLRSQNFIGKKENLTV